MHALTRQIDALMNRLDSIEARLTRLEKRLDMQPETPPEDPYPHWYKLAVHGWLRLFILPTLPGWDCNANGFVPGHLTEGELLERAKLRRATDAEVEECFGGPGLPKLPIELRNCIVSAGLDPLPKRCQCGRGECGGGP